MSSSLGFDTSMNNYTIDDLLVLLNLGSNSSPMEIANKINIFTGMFSDNNDISLNVQTEIIQFFNDIQNKLLNDISNNDIAENAQSYNYFDYNIENPLLSQLPLAAPNYEDDNDLNPENLIQCNNITQENIDNRNNENNNLTHQESIRISNKHVSINTTHKNYEFSDITLASVNQNRTSFKYSFNTTLINVTELYLSKIAFPAPYTISSYLNNNKFYITDVSNSIPYQINISDQYFNSFSDLQYLVEELNQKFHASDISNTILNHIDVSATTVAGSSNMSNTNSSIRFDLSFGNPISPIFTLNFDISENPCSLNYKLNTLLNLDISYTDISHVPGPNLNSVSNKIAYNPLHTYISLNDYIINYNQNLEVINNNIYLTDIIASVHEAELAATNSLIYKEYNISAATQNSRIYNGPVSLLQFELKFIDTYGNLQQIPDIWNNTNFNFILKITNETGSISGEYNDFSNT